MRLSELYVRDGGICHLCKNPVPRDQASRDHLIPKSRLRVEFSVEQRKQIGEAEVNVALAHRRCNSRRGSKKLEDIEIDYQSHQNPSWYFLRARKGYQYCKCPCMCKIQIPISDGNIICGEDCRKHYISYI